VPLFDGRSGFTAAFGSVSFKRNNKTTKSKKNFPCIIPEIGIDFRNMQQFKVLQRPLRV